jgi:hypothetical protein
LEAARVAVVAARVDRWSPAVLRPAWLARVVAEEVVAEAMDRQACRVLAQAAAEVESTARA